MAKRREHEKYVGPAGFHTFDYARHFLSCCSRMLGVDHVTSRGGTRPLAAAAPLSPLPAAPLVAGIAGAVWCDSTYNPKRWRGAARRAAGAIMLEYYGRNVGIKIMPTGVNCDRLLAGLEWKDTIWRRGELQVRPPSRLHLFPGRRAGGVEGRGEMH